MYNFLFYFQEDSDVPSEIAEGKKEVKLSRTGW